MENARVYLGKVKDRLSLDAYNCFRDQLKQYNSNSDVVSLVGELLQLFDEWNVLYEGRKPRTEVPLVTALSK